MAHVISIYPGLEGVGCRVRGINRAWISAITVHDPSAKSTLARNAILKPSRNPIPLLWTHGIHHLEHVFLGLTTKIQVSFMSWVPLLPPLSP